MTQWLGNTAIEQQQKIEILFKKKVFKNCLKRNFFQKYCLKKKNGIWNQANPIKPPRTKTEKCQKPNQVN